MLLDTHVLLWWLELHPRLTVKTRALIDDPNNEPILSVVSLWEIAVKSRTGKLKVDIPVVVKAAEEQRFVRLAIEDAHLEALTTLPSLHKDPFDQLLIAQAIAEGVPFLTGDRMASRYPVEVIAAS